MDAEKEHLKYFHSQTAACADYFEKWLYPRDSGVLVDGGQPVKESLYCTIYRAFERHNREKRDASDLTFHNCIACNLTEGARSIDRFLQTNKDCLAVHYYLKLYSFLFYTQAERLGVIYREIGYETVINGRSEFDWTKFPNLQMIKYWANFFKHPKAYMFLHHPDYYLDTDPGRPNVGITQTINTDFVKQFYSGPSKNEQLRQLLENKERVRVFFPDLLTTTKTLCEEFEKIITTISNDSNAIDKLNEYTTVDTDWTIDEIASG